jgi:hypothetical protein
MQQKTRVGGLDKNFRRFLEGHQDVAENAQGRGVARLLTVTAQRQLVPPPYPEGDEMQIPGFLVSMVGESNPSQAELGRGTPFESGGKFRVDHPPPLWVITEG